MKKERNRSSPTRSTLLKTRCSVFVVDWSDASCAQAAEPRRTSNKGTSGFIDLIVPFLSLMHGRGPATVHYQRTCLGGLVLQNVLQGPVGGPWFGTANEANVF